MSLLSALSYFYLMIFLQTSPIHQMDIGTVYEYEIYGTASEVHFTVTGVQHIGGGRIVTLTSWTTGWGKKPMYEIVSKVHISGQTRILISFKSQGKEMMKKGLTLPLQGSDRILILPLSSIVLEKNNSSTVKKMIKTDIFTVQSVMVSQINYIEKNNTGNYVKICIEKKLGLIEAEIKTDNIKKSVMKLSAVLAHE